MRHQFGTTGRSRRQWAILALAVCAGRPAMAAVTPTGDTTVAATATGTTIVGKDAAGSLTIDGGATLTDLTSTVGHEAGATGDAIVAGAGSVWANTVSITVGVRGTGMLAVANGGRVAAANVLVGGAVGGSGTVTVSGAASEIVADNLYVATPGAGTLTVSDGATVTANRALFANLADLKGNGTIAAKGWVADGAWTVDATHGTAQAIGFGTGGTLNLSVTAGGTVGAGHSGAGAFRLADARVLSTASAIAGVRAGSSGELTVTGTGSKWTVTGAAFLGRDGAGALMVSDGGQFAAAGGVRMGDNAGATSTLTVSGAGSSLSTGSYFQVGDAGAGAVTVSAGGSVTAADAFIGYDTTGSGAVTVTGAGSSLSVTHRLSVGYLGAGSLTVSDGATVTAKSLYADLADLHGNGTITATDGVVLDADVVFDATHGFSQSLPFGAGGTLNFTTTGNGDLGAGNKGVGSLRIADGRTVQSSVGTLGAGTGSRGSAVVTGVNTKWHVANDLHVGGNGAGALTVEAGATVTSNNGYIGFTTFDLADVGAAHVTGANSKWTQTSTLRVGYNGTGVLTIEDGGQVSSGTGGIEVGELELGRGTIVVRGGGAKLSTTGNLLVGRNGTGAITVEPGGQVSGNQLTVGLGLKGAGAVTVRGAGATMTLNNLATIGQSSGRATLTVADGGVLNSTFQSRIGAVSSLSAGAAVVTGAGSTWNSGPLTVGDAGRGTLAIGPGGKVASSMAVIGSGTNSVGGVTVDGAGATWTATTTITVGSSGRGTLRVANGGLVTLAGATLGSNTSGIGAVTVTGAGSAWTMTGHLNVGTSGTGMLTVADGAVVTASSLSIGSTSAAHLHVTGNGMLVLGNATTNGSVAQTGAVTFYAGPALAAGAYSPIQPYPTRTISSWTGSGTYTALGGTWNAAAKTFTVAAVTPLAPGATDTVSPGERLLITDPTTNDRAGVAFGGTVPGGATLAGAPMTDPDLAALRALLEPNAEVLAAWDFDTTGSPGPALVSFDVGTSSADLAVWHFDGAAWSPYTPATLSLDAAGVASFTVTSFSGYAVVAQPVPEPGIGLAAIASLAAACLARRTRRRRLTRNPGAQ